MDSNSTCTHDALFGWKNVPLVVCKTACLLFRLCGAVGDSLDRNDAIGISLFSVVLKVWDNPFQIPGDTVARAKVCRTKPERFTTFNIVLEIAVEAPASTMCPSWRQQVDDITYAEIL